MMFLVTLLHLIFIRFVTLVSTFFCLKNIWENETQSNVDPFLKWVYDELPKVGKEENVVKDDPDENIYDESYEKNLHIE